MLKILQELFKEDIKTSYIFFTDLDDQLDDERKLTLNQLNMVDITVWLSMALIWPILLMVDVQLKYMALPYKNYVPPFMHTWLAYQHTQLA